MANQTAQLARLLTADGREVEVVRSNPPFPGWAEKLKGLRALARLLPYLLRLWQVAGRVDLVHVMGNSGWSWHLFAAPAVWIAKARRRPVVVNYRGGEAEAFFARSFRWVRPTLEKVDELAVPSGFLQAIFARHGVSTRVVPNIVDLDRFTASAADARQDPADAPHIVVTRNLEPLYDMGSAIRAMPLVRRTLPRAFLSIAGSGPQRAELTALVAELSLGDAVRFTGPLDPAGVAALYRSADVMLNPSTADNMPNSLLEAMACGVPTVTTDVGGIPYMVRHEVTALLVPPRRPDAMAEAILRIHQEPGLAARPREAGRVEARRYTWTEVRPVLLEVYRDARAREPRDR